MPLPPILPPKLPPLRVVLLDHEGTEVTAPVWAKRVDAEEGVTFTLLAYPDFQVEPGWSVLAGGVEYPVRAVADTAEKPLSEGAHQRLTCDAV